MHLDYPRLEAFAAEVCESEPAGPGFYHADEVETSMMLALAPESVRMEKAAPEYPVFPETFGMEPMKLSTFNRSGVFGDPRPASAEKGERLVAGIVEESLRLVEIWRKGRGI
jgi:creatinine amidohydrolase